jgi:membrane protein implicated in regulation of membrane protease activity
MPVISVNLTAVAAIWMGGVLLLVPLIGLTLRYAVSPLIATIAGARAAARERAEEASLGHRLEEMEHRLSGMEAELRSARAGSAARVA